MKRSDIDRNSSRVATESEVRQLNDIDLPAAQIRTTVFEKMLDDCAVMNLHFRQRGSVDELYFGCSRAYCDRCSAEMVEKWTCPRLMVVLTEPGG